MTEIKTIKCGDVNCFIVTQDGNSILIDTGRSMYKAKVLKACQGFNIKLIVLTHGHCDHIQNASLISRKLEVPVAIHKADEELIFNSIAQPLRLPKLNDKIGIRLMKISCKLQKSEGFKPSVYLKEGDTLNDYGINATIIEVPGHTKGSIAVDLNKKYLFVGDALMNILKPTVSRLYNDREAMLKSAKRISDIPNRVVLFGHGESMSNRQWV